MCSTEHNIFTEGWGMVGGMKEIVVGGGEERKWGEYDTFEMC